ncbi:MAG: glycosyltransferase family 4 protein [Geminicoccaceae bacterium]|nr:glycosyltransferase family 4 protein [Geminicoccaceae bacterium]
MTYVFAHDPVVPCLGYLSAAPTVSTRADAASAGPRAHILGAINGFKTAGWDVVPFIKGDRVDPSLVKGKVQRRLEGSPLLRYAADMARLVMAERSRRAAWDELGGRVDWVYERFATMQVLGHRFKRAGVPWILETQGLFYYETRVERATVGFSRLAERIEKRAYRACDALIAVSPPLKDLIVRECGVDPDRILVVPNAVELERFDPALNAHTRHFDELTIGFVGGLIGWQALDGLMEAMAELEAESGLATALAVVGDGAMRGPWEARARALGLGGRVRFLGQMPGHLVKHAIAGFDLGYAGAKVMAIGQMYHSPIKLYEYMAQGVPVLAADFPDARGLVEGRGTGFLFEPGDKAMLKAAIRTAHGRRADLPAMGRRGRALVEREHTWTARVRAMLPDLQARLRARPEAGLVAGLAGA